MGKCILVPSMTLSYFTFLSTVQELGEMCYDSRQCKWMNPYSMCNNENECECQRGYVKLNNSCMPGKIKCNMTVQTEYSKMMFMVFLRHYKP